MKTLPVNEGSPQASRPPGPAEHACISYTPILPYRASCHNSGRGQSALVTSLSASRSSRRSVVLLLLFSQFSLPIFSIARSVLYRYGTRYSTVPYKDTGGSRDTHGTHKRTRGHTEDTDEPHKHPNSTTLTRTTTRQPKPETAAEGRLNSSKNSRRPGADHSPRPTQKRPPPTNPTLPPPATRAPPRKYQVLCCLSGPYLTANEAGDHRAARTPPWQRAVR